MTCKYKENCPTNKTISGYEDTYFLDSGVNDFKKEVCDSKNGFKECETFHYFLSVYGEFEDLGKAIGVKK